MTPTCVHQVPRTPSASCQLQSLLLSDCPLSWAFSCILGLCTEPALSPSPQSQLNLFPFVPLGSSGLSFSLDGYCSCNRIIFVHMRYENMTVGNPFHGAVVWSWASAGKQPRSPWGWEATENTNTHPEGWVLKPTTQGTPQGLPGHPSPQDFMLTEKEGGEEDFLLGGSLQETALWGCSRVQMQAQRRKASGCPGCQSLEEQRQYRVPYWQGGCAR